MTDPLMEVFQSVLGVEAPLSESDGPTTVEAWDSVTHLNLILAIEAEFGIQFDAGEIPELLSVEKIRSRVAAT